MCGITGAIAKNEKGKSAIEKIKSANDCLAKRGPDGEGIFRENNIALGHRRLSIIDTSNNAAQPMYDASGRYVIVFNGEFFNYAGHRKTLVAQGMKFNNHSDTEVLLQLYILHGAKCLDYVNGFFALAIYDTAKGNIFIARDRFGVKPLWIYEDDNCFLFASELKALQQFGIEKKIDHTSLYQYLQLNYIPAPNSIFSDVKKMDKASYLNFNVNEGEKSQWKNNQIKYYQIESNVNAKSEYSYDDKKNELKQLLEEAVQRRLVADVPLGAFLSGGIDSSIICSIASKYVDNFHTFSIGYKDEKYFDETAYANIVAKKIKTNHTVFSLSNDDLFHHLFDMLDYIDEPFADSSALAVYILSKETRKQVTVALSGDGADEMFAGYNKHEAEWRARQSSFTNVVLKNASPLLNLLPKSRNNVLTNKIRQAHRYAHGLNVNAGNRYYRWASYCDEADADGMLMQKMSGAEYGIRKKNILHHFEKNESLNEVLLTDIDLILENDMLVKVDSMSMANSLEVRNPFLDFTVVDFAFNLPVEFKINGRNRKMILKDAFKDELPSEIFNRGKHGFEVPLLKWMRHELQSLINDDLLNKKFIQQQNIFNYSSIDNLKRQLMSNNPGEATARIWALIVFQYWYKRNFS